MVAHVACIRARWRRDHAKSHAVMPLCMALTNDLSSCRETHNILIQRTLGLNLMPFAQEPVLFCKVIDCPQTSANHLGCLEEERRRNRQAQRLGGLEVNDQLELRGLLHGQVGRRGALQDSIHLVDGAPPHSSLARPIGEQASRFRVLPARSRRPRLRRRRPPRRRPRRRPPRRRRRRWQESRFAPRS
jgi:hypothetical protein